jgi:hypothetical protein
MRILSLWFAHPGQSFSVGAFSASPAAKRFKSAIRAAHETEAATVTSSSLETSTRKQVQLLKVVEVL